MSLNSLILLIGGFFHRVRSGLGLHAWFRHAYIEAGLNLLLGLVSLGLGMVAFRMFIVALYSPWCRSAASCCKFHYWVCQVGWPSNCVLLSTSTAVRKDMRNWLLSQEGDKWTVKLDVWDLGGPLDTNLRGWSATLSARVRVIVSRLTLASVLPLDFHGRIRVVRTMFIPGALHGVEASLFAEGSLLKLRAAILSVVCSQRQPLASAGAVFRMLDGSQGCDLAYCVVLVRFCLMRRYLARRPAEIGGVIAFWGWCRMGVPGHGPVHSLVAGAVGIGFHVGPLMPGWTRPGLPMLSNLAGPVQHIKSAIWDAWREKVSANFFAREGFRGGSLLDIVGS